MGGWTYLFLDGEGERSGWVGGWVGGWTYLFLDEEGGVDGWVGGWVGGWAGGLTFSWMKKERGGEEERKVGGSSTACFHMERI